MNIVIVGTGYVGTTTGACFAKLRHKVTCLDVLPEKVEALNKGEIEIFEPGLKELVKEQLANSNLKATTNYSEAFKDADISFIAVGTPSKPNGQIDLKFIKSAAKKIGEQLRLLSNYHVVVVKSTVVPETTEKVVKPLLEKYSHKKAGQEFGLCMNPETLKEGSAVQDFLNPDRIIIGSTDQRSGDTLQQLYKDFTCPIIQTTPTAAELVKYASNSLLALKITFANEIGNICKKLNLDVYRVMDAVGADKRLGRAFLDAGCGFGGSCFPKDIAALIAFAKKQKYDPKLLREALKTNERQKLKLVELLETKMSLAGKRITILGLAFKPNTDDVRESPAINMVSELKKRNSKIIVYDPKAMKNFQKIHPDIIYAASPQEALKDADACIITKAWPEFKILKQEDFALMKSKIILEGDRTGLGFEGVCW